MAVTTPPPTIPEPRFNRQELRDALERGEIVRLLAELEAGRITPQQLEAALEDFKKAHWGRYFISLCLGRY